MWKCSAHVGGCWWKWTVYCTLSSVKWFLVAFSYNLLFIFKKRYFRSEDLEYISVIWMCLMNSWLVIQSNLFLYIIKHFLPLNIKLSCGASHNTKTGHIFCNSLRNSRQLRCCVWLYQKKRGISTLPAPQTLWQPEQLLLKPGLWTQSVACLSLWQPYILWLSLPAAMCCRCSGCKLTELTGSLHW